MSTRSGKSILAVTLTLLLALNIATASHGEQNILDGINIASLLSIFTQFQTSEKHYTIEYSISRRFPRDRMLKADICALSGWPENPCLSGTRISSRFSTLISNRIT